MFSFLIDHVEIAQLKCNRETDESEVNLNEEKKKEKEKEKEKDIEVAKINTKEVDSASEEYPKTSEKL